MSTPTPVLAARQAGISTVRHSRMASSYAFAGALEMMGAAMSFSRNEEIYGEGEPADYLYKVVSGTVRMYRVLNDGRRQIGAFYLPGDILGLENGSAHRFTTEAIVDTTVWVLKRRRLEETAERDASVTHDLLCLTTKNLQHAEDHLLLLGRQTSLERVSAFLCEMDSRLSSSAVMTLPMFRRDIADYLGLSLETVSRALSMLRDRGVLSFKSQTQREIVLLDRSKLARLVDQPTHKLV